LLFHGASQSKTIAWIERRLPRDAPHLSPEHIRLHGFVICFVRKYGERIGWLEFRRDRLMVGRGWLPSNPAVVRIFAGWSERLRL
jgi:hypothetical protein